MSITVDTKLQVLNKIVTKLERQQELKNYEKYKDLYATALKLTKDRKMILYGGYALNTLLPKIHKIYKDKSLPDIDAFTNKAKHYALEIADELKKAGYEYVEVKSGVHKGTYKVFAEFEQILDITNVSASMYDYLNENCVEVDGCFICPPAFLMWSLYKELARPEGSGFRWEKLFKRYHVFQRQHKLTASPMPVFEKLDQDLYNRLQSVIKENEFIVVGKQAVSLYLDISSNVSDDFYMFEILTDDIDKAYEKLKTEGTELVKHPRRMLYEVSSDVGHVKIGEKKLCKIYLTDACYSYQRKKGFFVGSVDTVLYFLYSQYITSSHFNNAEGRITKGLRGMILAMEDYANKLGVNERFKTKCQGHEQTLLDVRKENWDTKGFRYRP